MKTTDEMIVISPMVHLLILPELAQILVSQTSVMIMILFENFAFKYTNDHS